MAVQQLLRKSSLLLHQRQAIPGFPTGQQLRSPISFWNLIPWHSSPPISKVLHKLPRFRGDNSPISIGNQLPSHQNPPGEAWQDPAEPAALPKQLDASSQLTHRACQPFRGQLLNPQHGHSASNTKGRKAPAPRAQAPQLLYPGTHEENNTLHVHLLSTHHWH